MARLGSALPNRHRPQLPRRVYEQGGTYFLTLCTQERRPFFGQVVDAQMHPNAAGRMVEAAWMDLPRFHPIVALDAYQLMPDHLHGIVSIEAADRPGGFALPDLVGEFKSLTTARYAVGVRRDGWPRFAGRLWQQEYFEKLLRSDRGLERARRYVAANPARWEFDEENPEAVAPFDR